MAKRRTAIKAKGTDRVQITRVSGPPPYEWLIGAIMKFANKHSVTRAAACCMLLDRGLKRDLKAVRVLRPFPVARGATGEPGGASEAMIPSFSIAAEYAGLPDRLDEALETLRAQHIERARVSAKTLAREGLGKEVGSVRGWRADVKLGDELQDGVVLQFAGEAPLPDDALVDVCDCVTDDMTAADVMRALWAAELERERLAPKKWANRHMVGVGWIHFAEREVR